MLFKNNAGSFITIKPKLCEPSRPAWGGHKGVMNEQIRTTEKNCESSR